jgi:hypothetical protein
MEMRTMTTIDFEALAKPIPREDVKQRQGPKNKMLSYITARVVMNRLDQIAGPANWRDEYETLPDGAVRCALYLRIEGEWVGKSDVGVPSDIEPVKGAYSEAFKRAAVKWGIGRELYNEGTAFEDEDAPPARQAAPRTPIGRPAQPAPEVKSPEPSNGQEPDTLPARQSVTDTPDVDNTAWIKPAAIHRLVLKAEKFWTVDGKPPARAHVYNRIAKALQLGVSPKNEEALGMAIENGWNGDMAATWAAIVAYVPSDEREAEEVA